MKPTGVEEPMTVIPDAESSALLIVGVKPDEWSREVLTWSLVNVARPGDRIIALHVLDYNLESSSSLISLVRSFDTMLGVYESFCNLKQEGALWRRESEDRRVDVEMAGRDRYLPSLAVSSSSASRLTESQLIVESDMNRARSVILEDRIAIQHREIQSLLNDNQRLAVAHIGIKDELNFAKRELQRLLETDAKVKAEREAKVREVYQNALRMEAKVRVIDGLGAELDQVRSDIQKLAEGRQELATELAMLNGEMAKAKPNSDRAIEIKPEIEILREEVRKGRAALELEKKTRASNLHHERGMEKTLDHLNREIVKLREELVSLETKTRAATAAAEAAPDPSTGLAASYGNPDDIYGAQSRQYPEANGSQEVNSLTEQAIGKGLERGVE